SYRAESRLLLPVGPLFFLAEVHGAEVMPKQRTDKTPTSQSSPKNYYSLSDVVYRPEGIKDVPEAEIHVFTTPPFPRRPTTPTACVSLLLISKPLGWRRRSTCRRWIDRAVAQD